MIGNTMTMPDQMRDCFIGEKDIMIIVVVVIFKGD